MGGFPVLSDRHNIVVIADEAHRTQYGFEAKLKERKVPVAQVLYAQEATSVIATGDGVPTAHHVAFEPPPLVTERYQVGYAQTSIATWKRRWNCFHV